ncbi:MAG TPA: TadG family pilus assembly protein [Tepidisphaeraceae bacterium]|jgi:Flp pilus assembly protein TadG
MSSQPRRGSVLIYAVFATLAIAGMAALAVDWGRVQVVKSELQAAADAAARFAASGLDNSLYGQSAAPSNAAAVVAQNKANGRAIVFDKTADVELGDYDLSKREFKPKSDLDKCNAVRVTVRCVSSRGSAVPMTFLGVLGRNSADVVATSIAVIDYSKISGGDGKGRYEYFIPATSNPWLAGSPEGTIASVGNPHNNPDFAGKPYKDDGKTNQTGADTDGGGSQSDGDDDDTGSGFSSGGSTAAGSAGYNYSAWGSYAAKKASPIEAGGITVSGGRAITFDGINGGANNMASSVVYSADGNPGQVVANSAGAENGIANVTAPINSVIGVFLDADIPASTVAPQNLNFATAASRDFTTLMPQLKQPFYIGDGRTSTGEVQQFVPPAGAKRLYISTMDSYEWSNNRGGFHVTAHVSGQVMTVR